MNTNEFVNRITDISTNGRRGEYNNSKLRNIFDQMLAAGHRARFSVEFIHKPISAVWQYIPDTEPSRVAALTETNRSLLLRDVELTNPFNRESRSHSLVGMAQVSVASVAQTRFDVLPHDDSLVTSLFIPEVSISRDYLEQHIIVAE